MAVWDELDGVCALGVTVRAGGVGTDVEAVRVETPMGVTVFVEPALPYRQQVLALADLLTDEEFTPDVCQMMAQCT